MTHRLRRTATCLAVAAIMTLMTACDGRQVYSHYEHTALEGWQKSDGVTFDVPKMKSAGTYDVTLGLRTDVSYPFTSLSVIVDQQILPAGKTVRDTMECILTDEKGRRLGPGINSYQYEVPVRELQLNANDSLHIVVRHHMRSETIDGINDVGIMVRRKRP